MSTALATTIDALVADGLKALADYDRSTRSRSTTSSRRPPSPRSTSTAALAQLAVAETGRGVFEDKAVKNIFACEHVTHSMAKLSTVG